MAKGNRGGQRAGGSLSGNTMTVNGQQWTFKNGKWQVTGGTYQAPPSKPIQNDTTSTASNFSTDYNTFMAITDDDKADVISNSVKQGVPSHLSQTDFQKFIYNSGLNDKPDVVDDATLNKMNGTEIFRTVNNVYDRQNDISYTANQIAKQVIAGRVTRTSDNGGSVYGRGIYFADNRSDSTVYGNVRGKNQKTAVIRGKLNNNAKVISYSSASSGASQEIAKGTKLGKALSKCDNKSAISIYAMSKGYNVISNGMGYLNVLNRNAITVSSNITPM